VQSSPFNLCTASRSALYMVPRTLHNVLRANRTQPVQDCIPALCCFPKSCCDLPSCTSVIDLKELAALVLLQPFSSHHWMPCLQEDEEAPRSKRPKKGNNPRCARFQLTPTYLLLSLSLTTVCTLSFTLRKWALASLTRLLTPYTGHSAVDTMKCVQQVLCSSPGSTRRFTTHARLTLTLCTQVHRCAWCT
jgi:hypothetical protein